MLHTILIDGNNWGFAFMQAPKLSAGGRETQAVFSFLQRIQNVLMENPKANVIVLWDGKSWRKDIYTEYKANRGKTEKEQQARADYYIQKEQIMKALALLGVRQMWGTNMEADDLASILSKRLTGTDKKVTLMTADQDWQQLVSPSCEWIDIIHRKHCTHENFADLTGFRDTEQFIEAKCILGDAGDNIKGLNRVGPVALGNVYKHYRSFDSFLGCLSGNRQQNIHMWKVWTGKLMPKVLRELDISEAEDKLTENLRLVDLDTPARPPIARLVDTKGKLDAAEFETFCHENAFLSFTRSFELFLLPFKENPFTSK